MYLRPNDTEIIGAVRFSNVVYVPELQKGWIVLPETSHIYDGKPAYLCDPEIPYTLGIHKQDYSRDLDGEITPDIRTALGLPASLLKLHTDALGQLCVTKWNTSFDEAGGSIMVFIFGAAAGAVAIILILASLMAVGGMFA